MKGFLRAVGKGNEGEVLRRLDENPALLEARDIHSNTPVIVSARHRRLGVMRLLVRRGADVNARGDMGRAALDWAAYHGCDTMVAFLLRRGAQSDVGSDVGITPLMCACRSGEMGVVRLLVRHLGRLGLGLESRDRWGMTALHHAVQWGYDKVVRTLLLAGADHTIRDMHGRTPRALAEELGQEEGGQQESSAECAAVLQWWEGKLERRYLLQRARCLHDASVTQRDQPTSQVPTYLEARVAAGHALPRVPRVEVVLPQLQGQQTKLQVDVNGKWKLKRDRLDGGNGEVRNKERHAMMEYVVKALNQELFTELLEGLL